MYFKYTTINYYSYCIFYQYNLNTNSWDGVKCEYFDAGGSVFGAQASAVYNCITGAKYNPDTN